MSSRTIIDYHAPFHRGLTSGIHATGGTLVFTLKQLLSELDWSAKLFNASGDESAKPFKLETRRVSKISSRLLVTPIEVIKRYGNNLNDGN